MKRQQQPQRILRPANPFFIAFSLLGALAFNLLPWPDLRLVPDLLALTLTFWCIHQPRKVGVGIAWVLGLAMDAANGALIGQHALAYACLAFGAHVIHRRVLLFGVWPQAVHVFVLLLLSQLIMLAVRLIAGGTFPGWLTLVGIGISALLWPFITDLLLAPQRAPDDIDETRPI
ncbi:MAG: rod shape-determining protein MreD [Pseudomonadota bacterium]|jgi:rod shape-determining protein MreD|nr:MAG: rod shape-determining protein MreD [Pseudomonadota bacterium]